jgi:hypothetical protein
VGDQHVEVEVAQDRQHDLDLAGGEADGTGKPFFLHADELSKRALGAGDFTDVGCVFRIMKMEDVDLGHPQRLEAFLKRAPGLSRIETAGFHVPVKLG